MPTSTKPFDFARRCADPDAQLRLINEALEEGHPGFIATAIFIAAKARGIADIASEAGLSQHARDAAMIREAADPTINTVVRVLDALGLQLEAKVKVTSQPDLDAKSL